MGRLLPRPWGAGLRLWGHPALPGMGRPLPRLWGAGLRMWGHPALPRMGWPLPRPWGAPSLAWNGAASPQTVGSRPQAMRITRPCPDGEGSFLEHGGLPPLPGTGQLFLGLEWPPGSGELQPLVTPTLLGPPQASSDWGDTLLGSPLSPAVRPGGRPPGPQPRGRQPQSLGASPVRPGSSTSVVVRGCHTAGKGSADGPGPPRLRTPGSEGPKPQVIGWAARAPLGTREAPLQASSWASSESSSCVALSLQEPSFP